MSKNFLNCKIAEDLFPLYSEGLCSQESQKLIKEHLRTCENCRKFFEQVPIPELKPKQLPDEKKTFLKINRKFRKNKFHIIFLSILSGILLLGTGYLSYGQATRTLGMKSFETIWQSIEVRKFANRIAKGDFDSYLQTVSLQADFNLYNHHYENEFFEQAKKNLEITYQNAFRDTSPKTIKINTCYDQTIIASENIPVSNINIIYQDGQELNLYVIRNLDGNLLVNLGYLASSNLVSDEIIAFTNCLRYASRPEIDPKGFIEAVLTTENIPDVQKQETISHFATLRFAPEYRETLEKSFLEFYQQGYYISECYFSELRYDETKKLLYYLVTIKAEDSQGSASLLTRIYSDYNGLIPPSQDMGKVYADNCNEKLEESLLKLFG